MKLGMVMTTFNRPKELQDTLAYLTKCRFPQQFEMFMVDDCSDNPYTQETIDKFTLPNVVITKVRNASNKGMFYGLHLGWSHFYDKGFDVLLNLDSDALVKPYWLPILLQLYKLFPENIISGFNTLRHPIHQAFPKYYTKRDIGGINMLFSREMFSMVSPHLTNKDWDWRVCWAMQAINKPFIVSKPSVVQHIGMRSVAGNSVPYPDVAEDWV